MRDAEDYYWRDESAKLDYVLLRHQYNDVDYALRNGRVVSSLDRRSISRLEREVEIATADIRKRGQEIVSEFATLRDPKGPRENK